MRLVQPAAYDVVVPIRGTVSATLPDTGLGFTIRSEFTVTGYAAPSGAVSYADFPGVSARSPDEATAVARRRLRVALSALGIIARSPISFAILDPYCRPTGTDSWWSMGRQTPAPLSAVAPADWLSTLETSTFG